MKTIRNLLFLIFSSIGAISNAQDISVKSPDNNIVITISNAEKLSYSVTYRGRNIVNPSPLGFVLKYEPDMTGNFNITDQSVNNFNETWITVVKSTLTAKSGGTLKVTMAKNGGFVAILKRK